MQPVLAGQDRNLDRVELVQADRRTRLGGQPPADDHPLIGQGVAAAGPGHEPPEINGQADGDRRQRPELAEGEEAGAQAAAR